MLTLGAPYSKDELLAAFSAETTKIHQFFSDIPTDQFFAAPDDVWSPAHNLVHLWLSSKPIVLALGLPKVALRLRFGKAKHASTSVAAIRTQYVNVALAGGGVASGQYVPQVKGDDSRSGDPDGTAEKAAILTKWQTVGEGVESALQKWQEDDLDRLVVPHPLIGKLTIREILFFTLYHNLHHVRDVQRLLGQPESEWFDPIFLASAA